MSDAKNQPIGEEEVSDLKTPAQRKADGAKRIAKQHLPVCNVSAEDLKKHFKRVNSVNLEDALAEMGKRYPAVEKVLTEREAALAENAALKLENDGLKKELAAAKAAK